MLSQVHPNVLLNTFVGGIHLLLRGFAGYELNVAPAKRKEEICATQRPLCPFVPTAQRSAHELPLVEKQDMDGCSVLGGQQMILTGQNFSSDSKVVFMEKTQGGWPQ